MAAVFYMVVLPTVYSLPCLILHVAIVRAIFRFRKTIFQASFYNIVIAMTFTDCVVFVASTLILRLPLVPFCVEYIRWMSDSFPTITTFFLYVQFHGLHFQQFVGVLIAINRFSMVVSPLKMERFWRRHTIKALVFTALLPTFMTFHIAVEGAVLECCDKTGWCIVNNLYIHFPNLHKSIFMTVSAAVCSFSSLLFNCATAVTLLKVQRQNDEGKATEKRLFLFSIIVFAHNVAILFIHLLSTFSNLLNVDPLDVNLFILRTALIDSSVVVTPLTVYFLSPSIRAAVKGKPAPWQRSSIPIVFAIDQFGTNSTSGKLGRKRIGSTP